MIKKQSAKVLTTKNNQQSFKKSNQLSFNQKKAICEQKYNQGNVLNVGDETFWEIGEKLKTTFVDNFLWETLQFDICVTFLGNLAIYFVIFVI